MADGFLEELDGMDLSDPGEEVFDSLGDLFAKEELEDEGTWFDWPAIPGARVHIAFFGNCNDKRIALERAYREKKQIPYSKALHPAVEEALYRDSMFKTVVKGWEITDGGRVLEFNEKNYLRLMKTKRFRSFVMEKSSQLDEFRERDREESEKN